MPAGFHEIRLNPLINYGSEIGPMYKTAITDSASGDEGRLGYWTKGKIKMLVSKEGLARTEREQLESFFRARQGARFGFRVRYWNKYLCVDEPLPLLTGTTAQLQFVWADAVNPETNLVRKPVLAADVNADQSSLLYAPDITLKRDGVAFPSATNWTLDRNTGIITFSVSQSGHTILWSGSFDIPMRFTSDYAGMKRDAMDDHSWTSLELLEVRV